MKVAWAFTACLLAALLVACAQTVEPEPTPRSPAAVLLEAADKAETIGEAVLYWDLLEAYEEWGGLDFDRLRAAHDAGVAYDVDVILAVMVIVHPHADIDGWREVLTAPRTPRR